MRSTFDHHYHRTPRTYSLIGVKNSPSPSELVDEEKNASPGQIPESFTFDGGAGLRTPTQSSGGLSPDGIPGLPPDGAGRTRGADPRGISSGRAVLWEVYVDVIIDTIQFTSQTVSLAAAGSRLWILLIPHIGSATLSLLTVNAAGGDKSLAIASHMIVGITAAGDALLTLVLGYSIMECAIHPRAVANAEFAFGVNICLGSKNDGGFTEFYSFILSLASLALQFRMMSNYERFLIREYAYFSTLSLAVFMIVIFSYSISYLVFSRAYGLLVMESITLVLTMLQTMSPASGGRGWVIVRAIAMSLVFILTLGSIAVTLLSEDRMCTQYSLNQILFTRCAFETRLAASFFCIVLAARLVTHIALGLRNITIKYTKKMN